MRDSRMMPPHRGRSGAQAGDGKARGQIDAAGEAKFDDGAIVGVELDVRRGGKRLYELAVGDEVRIKGLKVDGAPRCSKCCPERLLAHAAAQPGDVVIRRLARGE